MLNQWRPPDQLLSNSVSVGCVALAPPRIVFQPTGTTQQAVQFDATALRVGDLYELCGRLS